MITAINIPKVCVCVALYTTMILLDWTYSVWFNFAIEFHNLSLSAVAEQLWEHSNLRAKSGEFLNYEKVSSPE